MKSSFVKISLLAFLSVFALNACSMKCPFASDDSTNCCEGKCEKEGCCNKAEGKTCGGTDAGAEKKSCCGK